MATLIDHPRRRRARVLAALLAAAERSAELLIPAARCAWPDRERFEADPRGSRFSARLVAALRRAPVRLELPSPWPRS